MATKTKAKKTKKQTVLQKVKNLPRRQQLLLFLLVFAVLGGAIAVYRSFAYSWTRVHSGPAMDISTCRDHTTDSGGNTYWVGRWVILNKGSRTLRNVQLEFDSTETGDFSSHVPMGDISPGQYKFFDTSLPYVPYVGRDRRMAYWQTTENFVTVNTFSFYTNDTVKCSGGK